MTPWADKVDPNNPLPEYPRPQLARDQWVNLNGLWDYAVTKRDDPQPPAFEGKILVPFCIESALSGVKRKFLPELEPVFSALLALLQHSTVAVSP